MKDELSLPFVGLWGYITEDEIGEAKRQTHLEPLNWVKFTMS